MDQPRATEVAERPRTKSPSASSAPSPVDPARPTPPDPPVRPETPRSIELDAERQVRGLKFALGCSVAIALGVVLTALSVQSGRIPDREGHGWPLSLLFGPVPNRQGWRVVTDPDQLVEGGRYTELLITFTFVDFGYIVMYGYLLWTVISALLRGRWRTWTHRVLMALIVVDVVENLLSLPGLSNIDPRVIFVITIGKWVLVAFIGVLLLLGTVTTREPSSERRVGHRLRRTYLAVTHQRFAFVPMIALFVLSVLSGAAILEQLPDVLRRWISDGGVGVRHAVVSMISTLAVGTALIVAGRYRAGYAYRHPAPAPKPTKDNPRRPPRLWVWAVGPAVTLVGALIALDSGRIGDIIWLRLAIFTAVPVVLILVVSRRLRRRWATEEHQDEYRYDRPPVFDDRELTAVRLAGAVAGIGTVVVGGLSLIRAFVPLLTVLKAETGANLAAVGFVVVVGAATVVAPWVIAIAGVRRGAVRRTDRLTSGQSVALRSETEPSFPVRSTGLLAAGLGMFLLLAVWPDFAGWIGVAATANLALGSMAVMLSAVALVIQDRPTAEAFRWVGLRRSPLVSMLVLTLVLVGIFGGKNSIHEVDRGTPTTPGRRLTMAESFEAWLRTPTPCETTVKGQTVRPMLLIAAEGGGIRAAYWTVLGLHTLDEHSCGGRSALMSAGASGGSVGLTVARFSGTPDSPGSAAAVRAVEQMAAPGTLAQATDGTFVRDVLYGATGVPVHRVGQPDWSEWKDRARLIEDGWANPEDQEGLDWGDRPFLTPATELSPTTGELVLNSTDVKHSCRVWLSQLNPGLPVSNAVTRSYDPERSCDKSPGAAARTIDLFTAYGPLVPGADPNACLGDIRSATAALLTARFPYVTPSGVIGPCPKKNFDDEGKSPPYWPRTQLVDGGYIENSGLATLTDLSDDWLSEVRDHNAGVLAAGDPSAPLVVPIVVFLTNGDRGVLQPAIDSSPTSELAVPLLTYLRGGRSLSGNGALLERARAAVELDGFCPERTGTCRDVQSHFRSRVVVVDRVTQPEIGAPLGWVMSEASMTSMNTAMRRQLATKCAANAPAPTGAYGPVQVDRETEPSCRTGYATLGDLVRYYSTAS